MFSVIIPLYNKELSIKNTIQTVLNQSFMDFEIVVVNDGSTDSSIDVVESINDRRIRVIHQQNKGVSAARNKGIRVASNDWIVFLDADDLWDDRHLTVIFDMISAFPKDRVFCTSHTKSKISKTEPPSDEVVVIDNYFREVLRHVDFFWTSAVCVKAEVFEEIGYFPEGISRGEDLDLWARIGKTNRIIRSKALTVTYRLDAENKLTSKKSELNISILSLIKLKGTLGYERKYYKSLIIKRMKRDCRYGDFKSFFTMLGKYNVELIK